MKRFTRMIASILAVMLLLGSVPVHALPDILDTNRWPDPGHSQETIITYDWAYRAMVIPELDSSRYADTTKEKWSNEYTFSNRFNLPYLTGQEESAAEGTLFRWYPGNFTVPKDAVHTSEKNDYNVTIQIYTYPTVSTNPTKGTLQKTLEKRDYYTPQCVYTEFTYGGIARKTPRFIMGLRESPYPYTDAEIENALKLLPQFLDTYNRLESVINQIYAKVQQEPGKAGPGDYHPIYTYMLFDELRRISSLFTGSAIVDESAKNIASLQEKFLTQLKHGDASYYEPKQLEAQLTTAKWWLDFADTHRIDEPNITAFTLAGSPGVIDDDAHTITVYLPDSFDRSKLTEADAAVETNGWTHATLKGSFAQNTASYRVVAYDETSSVTYNGPGQGNQEFWADVQQNWKVTIGKGTPAAQITSFAVKTSDGKTRNARIDHNAKEITLNLPYGTKLTELKPIVAYNGTTISAIPSDYTKPQKITVSTVVSGTTYSTEYTVKITANKSDECKLLTFRAAGVDGKIDEKAGTVTLQVPYGTDLTKLTPEVTISEFASCSPANGAVQDFSKGAVKYTVTAQDTNTTKEYLVTVTAAAADDDTKMQSFSYQGIAGTINTTAGTVKLEVPAGTDLTKFAPTIVIPSTATIEPASGVAQDFSKGPVTYTVTAQSGKKQSYQATVISKAAETDEALVERMQNLLDKIIARYRSTVTSESTDWEFMNLGFYEHKARKPGDALPLNFDIEQQATELSRAKMTDYDRGIMMFTALGIDATKLDAYAGKDIIYSTKKETVNINNLVEQLYNYPVEDTINGPIFFLNAVDMGNYTIPADAKWTREGMLNTLLAHEYGSDKFQLDMVAMLMQAIAPYQDEYPAVKQKLNEGLDIILGNKSAPDCVGMKPGYIFYSTGYDNSEVTAQVICALCAMGIDPNTDPRFSDGNGKSVITVWLDLYANEKDGYFHHTSSVRNDGMATEQSCYALQWYLNFLKNGGAGHPYSLYADNGFDFSKELSTDASILSFALNGQKGEIKDDKITVKFPVSEPTKELYPTIQLAAGARLIAPSLPVTFIPGAAQPFTVQAEDGKTQKTYYVTVDLDENVKPANTEYDLSQAVIKDHDQYTLDAATIRSSKAKDGTIELLITVPAPADPAKLRVTLPLPYGATSTLIFDGKKNLDLSDWVDFTVTAGNGTVQKYRIKAEQEKLAKIESFSLTINGKSYPGTITRTTGDGWNISVTGVPSNASLNNLKPTIKLTEGASCSPLPTLAQDFRNTVIYTVTGDGMTTQTYTVTISTSGSVDPTPVDTSAKITSFVVKGKAGVIDHASGLITVEVDSSVDLTRVAPEVKVNSGCTVNPVSGQVVNLTMPLVYTVSNGEGQKQYTVTVTKVNSASQNLWDAVAGKIDPKGYQYSPDTTPRKDTSSASQTPAPSLGSLQLLENGKIVAYTQSTYGSETAIVPNAYSAATTYRLKAPKGLLGQLTASGSGLQLVLGSLRLTIGEEMDTVRGLDLTAAPASTTVQNLWKNQKAVTGLWNIQSDSVSGGMMMRFDCAAAGTNALVLMRYNTSTKKFETVNAKKWRVENGILIAEKMPAGIYGVAKK